MFLQAASLAGWHGAASTALANAVGAPWSHEVAPLGAGRNDCAASHRHFPQLGGALATAATVQQRGRGKNRGLK